MGQRLLALYDWIARVHFALVTLGGLTFIGAALAVLAGTTVAAGLLFLAGTVAVVFGVFGWRRERASLPLAIRQAPPDQAPAPTRRDGSKPILMARAHQIADWQRACEALKSEGEDLANRLRFMDTDKATEKETSREYENVKRWIKSYDDYRALWYSNVSLTESLMHSVNLALWTPVPGPKWRADWVRQVESRLRQLRCEAP